MTLRGDAHELVGDVGDALLDARLALLPRDTAQPIQRRRAVLRAVARKHVDVLDGHEEPIVVVIEQLEAVMRRAAGLDGHQALEAPDAVIDMHDQIAFIERRRLGDEILGAHAALGGADEALAQDVLLADQCEILGLEAALQPEHGQRDAVARDRVDLAPGLGGHAVAAAVLGKQGLHAIARTHAVGRDDHAPTVRLLGGDVLAHGVEDIGIRLGARLREARARPATEIQRVGGLGWRREGRQDADFALHHALAPFARRQIEPIRQQRPIDRAVRVLALGEFGARIEGFVDLLEPRDDGFLALMVERHDRAGEMIEQRLQPLVEQRQPMLEAAIATAGTDRLVERIVGADGAEQLAIPGPEAFDRAGVEQDFADRPQDEALQPGAAELRIRIEAADRFERVAEQIEPQGLLGSRWKQIDDAAAQGVFARLAHRIGADIAVMGEERGELVELEFPADLRRETRRREHAARRHTLQDRIDRGHDDATTSRRRSRREICQRVDSPADDLRHRRHPVIGQAVPGREFQRLNLRREEGQRLDELRGAAGLARDMQDVAPRAGQGGERASVESGWCAGQLQALTGFEPVERDQDR